LDDLLEIRLSGFDLGEDVQRGVDNAFDVLDALFKAVWIILESLGQLAVSFSLFDLFDGGFDVLDDFLEIW